MIRAVYQETMAADVMSTQFADLGQLLAKVIEDQDVIEFPAGLPGFADARRFNLRHAKGGQALCQLASCDPNGPVFRLLLAGSPRGHAMITAHCHGLSNESAQLLFLMTKVQIQADQWVLTANCRAPLVIDLLGREGEQIILHDETLAKNVIIASGAYTA
ncbi:Flagellar assembly factor FliW [Arboricoccus pini]|uniref:Flagellar assembly factor FliW n=1 Tax=Arboricoccus pini TaxID=1963835 RepID=A0A212QQJ7_9PROT|nr:flagellar assembly protein FliW [Arboricoccus pini]SNB61754.1 Flagellar assembly factor FliW [Arboricoccus pini]